MRFRPLSPVALLSELADTLASTTPRQRLRVALDGAAPAHPEQLADALVDPLRERGRPALRVSARDFLRPASLRLERGHTDPDSFYSGWLDTGALEREVLVPVGPEGSGQALPGLRDPDTGRSYRHHRVTVPEGGILLLDGTLLLGRGLPFDVTVHLWLPEPALARLLPEHARWQLPAYRRYAAEVEPLRCANVVVRTDHPSRPAVMVAE